MGFGDGSGISWTICKQSAPSYRQITTPTPRHSIFTSRMLFLTPKQQCQSTEGTSSNVGNIQNSMCSRVSNDSCVLSDNSFAEKN